MSYILDSLRRAEAERGRGGVPGLHSQAVPVPGAAPVPERTAASPWLMASAGVAPRVMGIGPVPAVRKLTERLGVAVADFLYKSSAYSGGTP